MLTFLLFKSAECDCSTRIITKLFDNPGKKKWEI